MEQTLLLIKPDATKAKNIGEIISILESKKFRIEEMIMFKFTPELAERFYSEHNSKEFFPDLLMFMTSGKTVAIILTGKNAISRLRHIIGPTDPEMCEPDTIRGKYASSMRRNAVHASDSEEHFLAERRVIFG
ncbi:MAG: nucleoside-diphosphate kinase [Candidatus Zophobacter franzmannii]|jgi:nucleoside-diphosphate kinase|nr:nucleoside-diphosphate kinase [Candidatus Zophobacter franzmannii]